MTMIEIEAPRSAGREIDAIARWVAERGLSGMPEADLLRGFCERCIAAGIGLSRVVALIDTLHPIYEGRAFRWRGDGVEEEATIEYGPTESGPEAENWRNSAFHHLLTTGGTRLRRRIGEGHPVDFNILRELAEKGSTDYLALIHRFGQEGTVGGMDCFYSAWVSTAPGGFTDACEAALDHLAPILALAIKCSAHARISRTLVEVYLGRDAGGRVLSGAIQRGVTEEIKAVLWFSDLRGYTTITDSADPAEIIPLLNDYADATISAIQDAGGDVLKLIGDGTLAIFNAEDPADACLCALKAAADMRERVRVLNGERAAQGRPVSEVYLGLHIGKVFFGNIGAENRLDFTVVGPAVNEVSRIASMCRSVDRSILFSAAFHDRTPALERRDLVSVGRYALRGVGRAQELFTLDPERLDGLA